MYLNDKVKKTNKSIEKFNQLLDKHVIFMIDDPASFLAPEWNKKRSEIIKIAKFSDDIDKRIEAILLIGSLAEIDDKEAVDVLLDIISKENEEMIVQTSVDAYDVLRCR